MSTEPTTDDARAVPHFSRQGDDGRTTLGHVGDVDKHDLRHERSVNRLAKDSLTTLPRALTRFCFARRRTSA